MLLPASYPLDGSTSPRGASSFTWVPSGAWMVSVVGSKSRRPASASAITVSGLVTKLRVLAEPSLRFGKFRLNELTMVFGLSVTSFDRSHWPMQGPQAFARTVAPIASRSASNPSRSIVARICSEPGVISSSTLLFSPCAFACLATDAALVMSSYEELVQLPMSADEISSGQPFSFAACSIASPILCARSGE